MVKKPATFRMSPVVLQLLDELSSASYIADLNKTEWLEVSVVNTAIKVLGADYVNATFAKSSGLPSLTADPSSLYDLEKMLNKKE